MLNYKRKLILLILYFLFNTDCVRGATGPGGVAPPPPIPMKLHDEHRLIQWCVNGEDEPELQSYPFSEFKPIVKREYFDYFKANVRFRYRIDLRPIKLKAQDNVSIGAGGNLYQRAHLVFNSEIRREFKFSVDTYYSSTPIEGLLVQVNYAPLGVGLPTGVFLHPKEFNCVDCRKPVGHPIACKKRTYYHPVHPYIMAFHHQMLIPEEEKNRRSKTCIDAKIPSQCIITSFTPQYAEPPEPPAPPGFTPLTTSTSAPGTPQWPPKWEWDPGLRGKPLSDQVSTCSPGPTAESECESIFIQWYERNCCPFKTGIWCDDGVNQNPPVPPWHIKHADCPTVRGHYDLRNDPTTQSMPVFECRPFTVNVCRPPGYVENSAAPWELERDLKTDYSNSNPPLLVDRFEVSTQCCNPPVVGQPCPGPPPGGIPVPTNPCPPTGGSVYPTDCIQRPVLPYDKNSSTEYPEPNIADCIALAVQKYYGRTSEVHANLVWYLPPCHYTSRVRFQLMVVHNFQRGIYSIVESDDYFDLKSGADNANRGKLNPFIPSPLFNGFPHTCESAVNQPDYLFSRTYQDNAFDYSRSYDACIKQTGDDLKDQVCVGVPKFVPHFRGSRPPTQLITADIPKCDPSIPNIYPKCESVCLDVEQLTEPPSTTEAPSVIKRTPHGAINIITNFCIMPICVFVARFYKETFNLSSFKGQKLWFWMHMVGAGGSTILMYMGFFSKKLISDLNEHIVVGNVYILCLGVSYISAWIRHKRKLISSIVEILHIGCGYSCFFLALLCINNATINGEKINPAIKIVVYIACSSLVLFYLGMTMHICSMDRKFGMKPKRLHFPTVEAKFDDLPVPGRNVRRFFLIVLLWINLPITISTLFL